MKHACVSMHSHEIHKQAEASAHAWAQASMNRVIKYTSTPAHTHGFYFNQYPG